jgi:pyruvate,water dikinase
MLIEIARARGDYMPEPSYGTHFFQDLVEARIYYLPLYPEEEGIVFNEPFLHDSENLLPDFLPGHADLAGAVKVIDIEKATGGLRMCVAMNADEDRALAFFRQSCADRSGS